MSLRVGSVVLLFCCLGAVQPQRPSEHGEGPGADRPRSLWDPPIRFSSKAGDACSMLVTGQRDSTLLRVSCLGPGRSYWCQYEGRPHTCRSYSNDPRHYFVQMMWGLRKLQNACQGPGVIKPQMCRRAPDDAQMVLAVLPYSQQRPESTRTSGVQQRPESTRTSGVRQRPESTRTSGVQQRPESTRTSGVQQRPESTRTSRARQRPESTRTSGVRQRPAESSRTTGVHMKTGQRSSRPRPLRTRHPPAERARPPAPTPSAAMARTPAAHRKRYQLARSYCWRSLQGVCSYFIGWFHQ